MKKGWIITLVLLFLVLYFQQGLVMSEKANKSVLLAQYDDTGSCQNNNVRNFGWDKLTDHSWSFTIQNYVDQYYINKCVIDNNNSEDYCCVCFENSINYPGICSQLFSVLSGTPVATNTPTTTPTPTNTPTPQPVNCTYTAWSACSAACGWGTQTRGIATPAQYGGTCNGPFQQNCRIIENCPINCEWNEYGPCSKECGEGTKTRTIKTSADYGGTSCTGSSTTTCINRLCSDIGTGGVIIVASTNQESLSVSTNALPTPTRGPTPTPEQARFNTIDYYLQAFRQPTPTRVPTPTVAPTITPYLFSPVIAPTTAPMMPTPTLRPESIIPGSLAAQSNTVGRTSFTLNTGSLSEIRIEPNPAIKTANTQEKPFLPQEQKLLAQNVGMAGGGIMVTLQQKTGSQFVTRQDELTVKRGNQFFSISNQGTAPNIKTVQKTQEKTNNTSNNTQQQPVAKLEINANNVVAQSSMALSVDPLSGILIVETPNGPQKVSIMPDEALGIILELKALNAGIPDPSILLVSENGKLIYRISGAKMEKFIGLLPIAIQKQVLVSADTGSIVKVELSLISSLLSFFTF